MYFVDQLIRFLFFVRFCTVKATDSLSRIQCKLFAKEKKDTMLKINLISLCFGSLFHYYLTFYRLNEYLKIRVVPPSFPCLKVKSLLGHLSLGSTTSLPSAAPENCWKTPTPQRQKQQSGQCTRPGKLSRSTAPDTRFLPVKQTQKVLPSRLKVLRYKTDNSQRSPLVKWHVHREVYFG